MDSHLIAEFDATVALVKRLREELEVDGWTVPGQRGTVAQHPKAITLKEQQTHLRGLARLLKDAKVEVPINDDELSNLLD